MMKWKCTVFVVVLSLFPELAKCQQGCSDIPNNLRFDCYPEDGASEQNCLNRGCCWRKPAIVNDEVPLDVPYCFYPSDYGYQLVSKEKTQTGYLLNLSKKGHAGPYGNDIENLAVDVRFEAQDRLHFKVGFRSKQQRLLGNRLHVGNDK